MTEKVKTSDPSFFVDDEIAAYNSESESETEELTKTFDASVSLIVSMDHDYLKRPLIHDPKDEASAPKKSKDSEQGYIILGAF